MKGDRRRRKRNEATLPFDTQDNEVQNEQLLPGIPNEVTLEQITTRLHWRTFHVLSSVSRAWKQAIQRRHVYDARVRSKSTETLAVISYMISERRSALALYSFRDDACYPLPPTPYLDGGIPWFCQCITLDGKIYVLGGITPGTYSLATERVYVLDLVGQCQWKKCASMQKSRQRFGTGVINGKIYVFGGTSLEAPVCGSEVYDPNVDTWSAIQPMPSWRFDHEVTTMGKELVVYGGKVYTPIHRYQTRNRGFGNHKTSFRQPPMGYLEAYDPAKDNWRLLSRNPWNHANGIVFMAQGRFHSMPKGDIYVYDIEKKSRTRLHSSSFGAIEPVEPYGVVVMDDELLAAAFWRDGNSFGRGLIRSRGLGREDEDIVWEKADFSHTLPGLPVMCSLRL